MEGDRAFRAPDRLRAARSGPASRAANGVKRGEIAGERPVPRESIRQTCLVICPYSAIWSKENLPRGKL